MKYAIVKEIIGVINLNFLFFFDLKAFIHIFGLAIKNGG